MFRNYGFNLFSKYSENPRCPVKLYTAYKCKRPKDTLIADAPFYLNPLGKWQRNTTTWFSRQKVGKNKLGTFAKHAAAKAGLEGRHTNHGGKK